MTVSVRMRLRVIGLTQVQVLSLYQYSSIIYLVLQQYEYSSSREQAFRINIGPDAKNRDIRTGIIYP